MTTASGSASIDARLSAALRSGTEVNLIPRTPVEDMLEEEVMRGWGSDHDVDAKFLRELLLCRGLGADAVDPRGLRLRGARIRGRLDLDLVDTPVALWLDGCLLEEGVSAEQAHLPRLGLVRCRLHQTDQPALGAESLVLDGPLRLDGSVIVAEGAGDDGAIRLTRARIGGPLNISGATVRSTSGPALHAEMLDNSIGAFDGEGLTAEGAGELGAVRLLGARIGDHLQLSGATIRNVDGPALYADRLQAHGTVFLTEGFTAEGAGEHGAVRLLGARIGNQLHLRNATIRNLTGPALHADGLQTGADVFLTEGFTAEGAGEDGAVRLLGARIGSQLHLQGATLLNANGPALFTDGLQTGGHTYLTEGFTAEGAGERGAVRMVGARIGDGLHLWDATLRNAAGPALFADGLQTGGDVYLIEGFTAEGTGEDGAVRMVGARIGDGLHLSGATLRNPAGPALQVSSLQTGGDVSLDEGFLAEGAGERGVVRLSGRISGKLTLVGGNVRSSSDALHRWLVDGLTYSGVPQLARERTRNREAWLELLHTATPAYAAQPYQQLAAAYRSEGHDSDVRAILIAQRQDQIARGGLSRGDRWWARITGLLLGYGYQPWRALLYLGAVLAASVTLAVTLGAYGALARSAGPTPAAPAMTAAVAGQAPAPVLAETCTLLERIGKGLDLGTPFLPRAAATRCEATSTATGAALTVSTWLLQVAAWALAALFVAGFTGIVRKT